MRFLSWFLSALTAALAACSGGASIDSRLLKADSLLSAPRGFIVDSQADEAFSILDSIDIDALNTSSKAANDILRTYALYRLDYPLTARYDSLIDNALATIHDHHFLTRAYIVKGLIAEESDIPDADSAIKWYKLAASEMDTTEHEIAGFVNMRIANYYQINAFVDSTKIIDYYREALRHYSIVNDKTRMAKCQYSLSFVYELVDIDSCRYFADKALSLGIEHQDSLFIAQCYILLAGVAFDTNDFNAAIAFADKAECLGAQYNPESEPFYYKAAAYSRLNKLDSALFYARQFPVSDSETNIQTREFIAEATGDFRTAFQLLSQRYELREEQMGGQLQQAMIKADLAFENAAIAKKNARQARAIMFITFGAILVITSLVGILIYRHLRHRQLLSLLRQAIEENESYFADKSHFRVQITSQLKSLLLPISQLESNNVSVKNIRKSVVASAREFLTDDFFADAEKFVNASHNNIVERIRNTHPLSSTERNVLILSCCGLKNHEIAILLDYTSVHTIENIKSRIASYSNSGLSLNKFIETNKIER